MAVEVLAFMRFRRKFLTALAPLIGMSALMTAMAASPEVSRRPLVRLIQSVIHLVTPSAEMSSPSAARQVPSARAVLPLTALSFTPYSGSLWMLTGRAIPLATLKRSQRTQLRC